MLYRRLWFGLLVIIFVLLAPAVVFYTAGYRWNVKKGAVERNGTLIFDTVPAGARIVLNGQDTGDRTPTTRQDIAPGTYRIRLERDGYWPWEKTLEVRPSRVTFVSDVRLWPQAEPTLAYAGHVEALAASPDGRTVAVVEQDAAMGRPRLLFQGASTLQVGQRSAGTQVVFAQEGAPTGSIRLLWDPTSRGVQVEDGAGNQWVASAEGRTPQAVRLPEGGVFRWDGAALVGALAGERFAYMLANGEVRQTPFAPGVRDTEGNFRILEEEGAEYVVEDGHETERFALPQGSWAFGGREQEWLLFRSRSAPTRWFAFDPSKRKDATRSSLLPSDMPPLLRRTDHDAVFLTAGGGELWTVTLGGAEELLVRTGDALRGALWATPAGYVFYATDREVVALSLDPRDGRAHTRLAEFDHITQITVARAALFVAGERRGVQGVWTVPVE